MPRMKRTERVIAILKRLVDNPGKIFSLTDFARDYSAAKSSVSEDVSLMKRVFQSQGFGSIETFAGAAGGVRYSPHVGHSQIKAIVEDICKVLSQKDRILPGGFIYMTDMVFSPQWAARIGEIFVTRFKHLDPECVVTVETKGIPMALMTARCLNVPLVVCRRDVRATEGSSVNINYISGSSRRIQTMSLPKRALPAGTRALIIDDFMRGGGTARGMVDLLQEFQAKVVGIGVFVETQEPQVKLVNDYTSLILLKSVDEVNKRITLEPSEWVVGSDMV